MKKNFMHFLNVAAFLALTASAQTFVPPSAQGTPGASAVAAPNVTTDTQSIADTVASVNQKSGAGATAQPNLPAANTTVTAVNGQVVSNGTSVASVADSSASADTSDDSDDSSDSSTSTSSKRSVAVKRQSTNSTLTFSNGQVYGENGNYVRVFKGTGMNATDRDAAIEGTAYLTYTLVNNATYNIADCLAYCDSIEGCVFVNLYYEFNNPLLDFVFSQKSNLKCVAYGDIHNATEKTNWGGQQLEAPPAPLTYIQASSGWAATTLTNPQNPPGYSLVFGPVDGANNAPGYMGFAFIDQYDVNACAALCNTRGPDSVGGACQYFNIWRALVDGVPTTYTCAFYYIVADVSTAVNYGQGDLVVTYSRGYKRTSLAVDGGFEAYTCSVFCYTAADGTWVGTSPAGGTLDASIFHYAPYARSGSSVGLLGSASGVDALSGTLTVASPINTVAGASYVVTFFTNTQYASPAAEAGAFTNVLWNNQTVGQFSLGYAGWTYNQVLVTGTGSDVLALYGGSAPAWVFVDDIYVFAM
ncbi:hypothetical protein H0H92_010614 [Tricholoma furcatifolium]|nr:hypothetical protein H0H92_010614 [Tricholoma furcatifolium]